MHVRRLDVRPMVVRPLNLRTLDAKPLNARPMVVDPLDVRPLNVRLLDSKNKTNMVLYWFNNRLRSYRMAWLQYSLTARNVLAGN